MESMPCPICNNKHNTLARYPNAVCNDCLHTHGTKDNHGNDKYFFNRSFAGGIKALVNGKETFDYSCFVNQIKCMADEARFGGIVVSKIFEKNLTNKSHQDTNKSIQETE